jgi:hypothetical protein
MDDIEVVPLQSGFPAQRRWTRYLVAIPVRLTFPRLLREVSVEACGLHLNCGGMAVSGVDLPIGKQIGVEFVSPSSGQLRRMWCIVRNHYGYRYGLEFIAEDEIDQARVTPGAP